MTVSPQLDLLPNLHAGYGKVRIFLFLADTQPTVLGPALARHSSFLQLWDPAGAASPNGDKKSPVKNGASESFQSVGLSLP